MLFSSPLSLTQRCSLILNTILLTHLKTYDFGHSNQNYDLLGDLGAGRFLAFSFLGTIKEEEAHAKVKRDGG